MSRASRPPLRYLVLAVLIILAVVQYTGVPTAILHGSRSSAATARTTFVVDETTGSSASFLPLALAPLGAPPRLERATSTASQHAAGAIDDRGVAQCRVHEVPSQPRPLVPSSWRDSSLLVGMATTPARTRDNLAVWAHWLRTAPQRQLGGSVSADAAELPMLLVLTAPLNASEAREARAAEEDAQARGLHLVMRAKEAAKYEVRYVKLVEELWEEALQRERVEGVRTDWFAINDDDTFFPDFNAVARLLSDYDSNEDWFIGAESESSKQVEKFGNIAYGGGGIFISRALLEKLNRPGIVDTCLEKFRKRWGGDAVLSDCVALVLNRTLADALTVEPTLHQVDLAGDASGLLQAGLRFTSLHHWRSWARLFPEWTDAGKKDRGEQVLLLGRAARAVGGDNWARRYVFDEGRVVVALGYSITTYAQSLSEEELGQIEHTWHAYLPSLSHRPPEVEGTDKRTYYLSAVRQLDDENLFRFEHKDRDGRRVDVVWDQREG